MRIGLTLPAVGPLASRDAICSVASLAEELGFSSLWVSDHVALPIASRTEHPVLGTGMNWPAGAGWLDPFVALTCAATATSHARLGTAVLVLPLRPVLLVAKAAASVDLVSDGRLSLGIGIGWLSEEFALLGAPFLRRGERAEEAVTVLRRCWGDDPVCFSGEFHELAPFSFQPKPPQGPGLPILVGGASCAAIRRAASVGDGWLPSNLLPDALRSGVDQLRALAEAKGRATNVEVVVRPSRATHVDRDVAAEYGRAGADTLVLETDSRWMSSVGEVVRQVRSLGQQLGL
jgi:probable F420-dependent oxidoreductase